MKVRVTVMLKEGVLDPQGKAVEHALHVLDFSNVGEVRIGRVIELDIDETERERARAQADAMARALLANLVIEDFTTEVVG
ncbi:phosphoribosylformylglycinamidine synthase subunit PurS [Komagataeibacter oboediens]|uniref:phosphoribosylformylglycinamidine synthase subunit PurS n=1 Tax=Komagataeibacter oboediens TaxID=65958 RepID=UPI0023DBA2E5|nr:phosphoribosylformylglycinamidine synthase subunit PurS [Komagataeibacter oboediens]WEQ51836.1 phosphoribosylformylglycinamidine synthase subunit PurS [Komagataeibacter oboediens]